MNSPLHAALVGTEGTCMVILEATLRLVDSPPSRSLLVLGYPDVFSAGNHVPGILRHKPIGLEGLDDLLVEDMKAINLHPRNIQLLPDSGGWRLAEFGGNSKSEADAKARDCMEALKQSDNPPTMKLFGNPAEEKMIWTVRESGLGATAHVPGKEITWEGWEDAAVPPDKVGDYLRDFRKLLDKFDYACDLYGHFGEGCIHTRIDFDLATEDGIKTFHAFLNEAADLVVRYGGSLSGEHSDGQSKAEFLPKMFGDELVAAFREFKSIWDPDGKMNRGKIVDAYLPTENLRLGAGYKPVHHPTHFQYSKDNGEFIRVVLRCVGIGNCRQHHSQTMCPSYRVTREEKHSTRGRARLLFETLRGEVITDLWQSKAMKEALDLCLACKGCKGDCPVHVDMATYKSEFLAHYYRIRRRPRQAYVFGWIHRWCALASHAPGLVNWLAKAPGLGGVMKSVAGMHPDRRFPRFAPQTFRRWFLERNPVNSDKPSVILWPDTFNNYFHPETAQAAVALLEAAGFQVRQSKRQLCCRRPLYDFGLLDQAKQQLRRILIDLSEDIDRGIPVVGLEPACVTVLRDELTNLFPEDEIAQKLVRQSYFFSEFPIQKAPEFVYPKLDRKALLHGHCHQKATVAMEHDQTILRNLGLDWHHLDSGCCGMAGSFGFEKEKFEVSRQIGELVLLPAVRTASANTLIVADGFSCRDQIAQLTDRRGLHIAEVLFLALRNHISTEFADPQPDQKKVLP